jgi:hypothetical protein
MKSDVKLFRNLLVFSEKIMTPIGIWPTDHGWSILMAFVYIFLQLFYFVLVTVKNLVNPERESVENAFTLSNGGLMMVVFYMTRLAKRHKFLKLMSYIKVEEVAFERQQEKDQIASVGKEYQVITRCSMLLLATSILMRFLLPIAEFSYMKLTGSDETYELPPSMGIPTFIFGELITHVIETALRCIMLGNLIGICSIFILAILYIETKFLTLALDLEFLEMDDDLVINNLIKEHNEILEYDFLLIAL